MVAAMSTTGQIGKYWDERNANVERLSTRLYWYDHPTALRFYRDLIVLSDQPLSKKPIHCFLESAYSGRTFKRAISIACGSAHKESALLHDGIVEHFDLFELSESVVAAGSRALDQLGLQDRYTYTKADLAAKPELAERGVYDLVHWDNGLHHMMDTEAAILLSRDLLAPGGLLIIDDYMGPSYMQTAPEAYAFANIIRGSLPRKYLKNNTPSRDEMEYLDGRRSPKIPVEAFLRTDPSEMADAGNIVPSAQKHLPGHTYLPTGGICFFLALRPLFGNFDENDPEDEALLRHLLEIDRSYTVDHPEHSFHGFITWEKPVTVPPA
jgi:SAM-dependent methyltransferase